MNKTGIRKKKVPFKGLRYFSNVAMLVGTGKFSSMIVPLSSSREINVKSQSWAKLTIPWKYFFYFQDCHDLAFVQKA